MPHPKVGPAASLLSLDETGLQEHLQVVADRGLAQPERLSEVTYAGFAVWLCLDQAEEPQSAWVCERFERSAQLVCLLAADRFLKKGRAARSDGRDRLHNFILTWIDTLGQDVLIDKRRYLKGRL